MSEPDNFLTRWSRRKREAAEDNGEPDKPAAIEQPAAEKGDALAPAAARAPQAQPQAQAPAAAEFDLNTLPPIESIGPDTDISAFLKSGVPSALRHAALRRVWTADPAIRDFKGLAENDWDFNDPDAIPGFGKLDPDFDVRKMVARVFGEDRPADAASTQEPLPATDEQPVHASQQSDDTADASAPADPAIAEASQVSTPAAEQGLVQREENIALQQDKSAHSTDQNKPRRHGGALPYVFPEY